MRARCTSRLSPIGKRLENCPVIPTKDWQTSASRRFLLFKGSASNLLKTGHRRKTMKARRALPAFKTAHLQDHRRPVGRRQLEIPTLITDVQRIISCSDTVRKASCFGSNFFPFSLSRLFSPTKSARENVRIITSSMQGGTLYFKFLNSLSMFNSFFKLAFCTVSNNLPPKNLGGPIAFFLIDLPLPFMHIKYLFRY